MEEVDKRKSKNTKGLTTLVVFLAIFAVVIILLVNLFGERTTVTTGGTEVTSSESLYCTTKSKNIDGAFFDLLNAVNADQAIKVIFKNRRIDSISYNADATYLEPDVAKRAEADNYAKYGNYVQENGKNMDEFSPNFSIDNVDVKIDLYANSKQLNNKLAKIFMIDTNDSDLSSYTSKVLSTLYEAKGFKCESNGKS